MRRSMRVALIFLSVLLPALLAVETLVGSSAAAGLAAPTPPFTPRSTVAAGTPRISLPPPPFVPTVPPATVFPATVAPATMTLPTVTPSATPGTMTATTTGTATGSATPTGTAAPTVCSTGTATGPATGTATSTVTATGTPGCATATATASATAPAVAPTACPATAPAAATGPLSPAGASTDLPALRTRTTRTFALGNGKYQRVISQGSLNYQDAQGKWQPIDTTLGTATMAGYAAQTKAGVYTAAFPADLSAKPVTVSSGGASVSFALVGARGTSATCGNTATYANALPGVTLAYRAESDALTETLTLASAAAPATYLYTVQASAGLTARANSAGGIDFVDSAGKTQLAFTAPVIHDSAKKKASGKVVLQLGTGGTTVSIVADPAWLKDPARVYPVVIDPNVVLVGPRYSNKDCFISGGNPGNNLCGWPDPTDSVAWNGDNGGNRSLLQFDVSDFNTNLTIQSATVYMFLREYQDDNTQQDVSGENDVSVRRITTSWDAGSVTWNSPWQTRGGDFAPPPATDTKTVGTSDQPDISSGTTKDGSQYNCVIGDQCAWDITPLAQGWIGNSFPNDGILFEDIKAANTNDLYFCSSTGQNQCSAGLRPYLTITYTDPGSTGSTGPAIGSRPFYTLVGGQIDDRMSLGVNIQSGNLLVTANDLTIAGTGLNLAVTRSYNSLAVYKGMFGNHWAMNGGTDLFILLLPNTNDVILQNNTGYRVGFTDAGGGNFQHVPGLDADLYRYGDGSYTLTYHANTFQYRFDNTGRLTWQQDKNGNRINYSYNGNQLASITDTEGRAVTFDYSGNYVSHIHDQAGSRDVYYGYQGDNLHQVTDANGGVTYFDYDSNSGNLQTITDLLRNHTDIVYYGGALSRIHNINRPGIPPTYLDYPSGNGTEAGTTILTDPNGNQVTLMYDQHGLVTHTDMYGHTTDNQYNDDYHVTSARDGYGNETRYQYNAGDDERLTDVYLPTGAHTSTSYSGCNQPTQWYPCTMTDAQGHSARDTYNGFNVSDVANDLGGTVHTDYDGNGRPLAVRDARGNTTTYQYDGPHHELSQIIPPVVPAPNTLGNSTLTYDPISRKQTVTDGKGQLTQYSYDNLDRTRTVIYAGNDAVTYTYDANGNLLLRQEGAGATGFTYDALNRQVTKTLPTGPYRADGTSIGYGYDNDGHLAYVQDVYGTVIYHYNAWNLLDVLTDNDGRQITYTYDNNNHHSGTTFPAGSGGSVTVALGYDASERLAYLVGTAANGGWLTHYQYSYQNGGVDTALRQSVSDDVTGTTTYTYDAGNRLIGATATGGQPSRYQYAYDLNGNRTGTVIGGAGTSATFNAVDEEEAWNPGQPRRYTYDANGNEVNSSVGEARVYNSRDQTTGITGLNGTVAPISYLDGGQGERTDAGGSHYVNASVGISRETKGGTTTLYTRTPAGQVVSELLPGGARYYYLSDGLGSVVALVDVNGNVAARYGYDPYGQTVVKTGSAADSNPFRYTGAYLDSTGLYKMGARYYDPARGRFTQLDPLGSGYIYASDNPVNFTDPSGLRDEDPSEDNNPPPSDKPDGNPDFPTAPPGGSEFDSGPFHYEPTGESRCSSDDTLQYEYEIHTYDLPSESYRGTVWLDSTDPCPSCNDTRLVSRHADSDGCILSA
ncbi:MAG: DNRLRE domain-containing protein [Thermomicrobiales bacterium]